MANRIKFKQGVKSKLPSLELGEPGFCTDTGEFFIGGSGGNVKIINDTQLTAHAQASYGTCSTAAGTVAKTVTLTNFTLATGAAIKIKFTITNTAANPTLNVNSSGAKAIYYKGAAITAGYLIANSVCEFVYDGTYWQLVSDETKETAIKNAAAKTSLIDADTLPLSDSVASNVTKKITFANIKAVLKTYFDGLYNNYTHPTTTGNKHIPSGGASGQILRWSADGTAVWGTDNNTTYSVATTSANGLMSSGDKTKLEGIAANANNYSHPTGDGNSHIPATGTANNGKFLRAGSAANSAAWQLATASDVGLGSVQNYGIATQAEAEAGTSNVKYTTPLRVFQAITKRLAEYYKKTEIDAQMENKVSGITMTGDISIYVSTTGNDTTGNGSSSKPFATINSALIEVRKYVGIYAASILLMPGIYKQNFELRQISCPLLILRSSDTSNKAVLQMGKSTWATWSVGTLPRCNIQDIIFEGEAGTSCALAFDNVFFGMTNCTFRNIPSSYAVRIGDSASGNIQNCIFNNIGSTCIAAADASHVFANNNTGSGNGIGARASGGFITRGGTHPSATTDIVQTIGGRVFD